MITLYDEEISSRLLYTEQHTQSTTIMIKRSSNMLAFTIFDALYLCMLVNVNMWIKAQSISVHQIKWSCLFIGLGLHHSIYMNYFYNVFMNILKHQSFGGMNFPWRTEISQVSLKTSSLVFQRLLNDVRVSNWWQFEFLGNYPFNMHLAM